jgi:HK97 gp10 family phage protein
MARNPRAGIMRRTGAAGITPQLRAKLEKLTDEVRADVRAVTEAVLERARESLEAATPVKTGQLRKTVKAKMNADGMSGRLSVGGKIAPYAHLIEFGHRNVDKGGAEHGTTPAQPFITPVAEQARSDFAREIEAALRRRAR